MKYKSKQFIQAVTEYRYKPKEEKQSISEIGEELKETYNLHTLESGEIVYYEQEQGIFQPDGKRIIEQAVRGQVNRNISRHDMDEIIYYIQNTSFTPRKEFDSYSNWIHVGNGWINRETKEFKLHDPKMLSFAKIPCDYVPGATNPEQRRFFAEVFEPEDLNAVQKFFGYLLLKDNRYKKAFELVGPKDTGKSTVLILIEKFAGQVSHVSLHDLAAYNHNVAGITKSIVNTTSELPKYKLKDVALFKGITGGDELSFREIYGRPYSARVRAKFVMASNELPDFDDMDQTFVDRWVVFRFSNVFKRGEDMDVNILERITTPAEMSGLLNYALEGLDKLLQDGYFKNEDYAELRAKWESITSKIGDYKEKYLIAKEGAVTPSGDMYDHYKANTSDPLSAAIFGREIKKFGFPHKQARVAGKRVWVYEGVTMKDVVTGDLGNFCSKPYSEDIISTIEEDKPKFPVTPKTEDHG